MLFKVDMLALFVDCSLSLEKPRLKAELGGGVNIW
jgi:hypothetical protein